ncbi:NAD(P)/FAD-dependent oxidoreductase [Aestuariibius insulae]|uniref:NAD(P)/FAD-dependent oxidoreductase n=1 Tax=Aestuariibius insulae TaxID=2058287 RepID=UPI00345F0D10
MTIADLTVRGAGIFGLSVAYACLRRGALVTVVDPNGIASGASGGIVGALAPHVPENWNPKKAFQLESLLMAEEYWADVTDRTGLETGYLRSGRLRPIPDDDALALARRRAQTARDLWQDNATWEITSDPGPFAPVSPTSLWIRDTLSAHLHPRRATQALAKAVETFGGLIQTHAPEAPIEVWATGASGLTDLSHQLNRTVGTPIKGQAALLDHDAAGAPQLFADTLHIIPHTDGTTAIGSTTEREFDDLSTNAQLDALIDRAKAAVPALAAAPVIARWAGLRPRARSRAPMLGPHPAREGTYIANGGFKIGFGMAPLIGEVMADLILDGHDRIPAGFRVTDNL